MSDHHSTTGKSADMQEGTTIEFLELMSFSLSRPLMPFSRRCRRRGELLRGF